MSGVHIANEEFLEHISDILEINLKNDRFDVADLAREMKMSRSQIYRKLKAITNRSASQFIRETRLRKAKELIEKDGKTMAEIAYEVGFSSPSYFDKSFHKLYGFPPGEVKRIHNKNSDFGKIEIITENNQDLMNSRYYFIRENLRLTKVVVVLALIIITILLFLVLFLIIQNIL